MLHLHTQKLNTIRKTKYYVEDDFVYLGQTGIV
jgi:hypothetical protein